MLRGNYSVYLNKGRSDTLEAFHPAIDAWGHRILSKSPSQGLLPQMGPFYLSLAVKARRLLAWLGGISPHTFHSAFSKQKNLNRKLTLKGDGGPPRATFCKKQLVREEEKQELIPIAFLGALLLRLSQFMIQPGPPTFHTLSCPWPGGLTPYIGSWEGP